MKKYKYAPRKTLLKGEYFEASTYEAVDFDSDEVFSKLIYNDVKFAKFFRTYKRGLSALQEEIGVALDEIYARLEREFMIYKSEFENEMLGNASFLNKILSALKSEFAQIKDEKLDKIAALSAGHERLRDEILKAGEVFGG